MTKCNCYRKCACLRLSHAGGLVIGGLIGEGVMFSIIDWGTWSKPSRYILFIPWSDVMSCQMRAVPTDLLIRSDWGSSSNFLLKSNEIQIKGENTSLCCRQLQALLSIHIICWNDHLSWTQTIAEVQFVNLLHDIILILHNHTVTCRSIQTSLLSSLCLKMLSSLKICQGMVYL